MNQFHHSKNPKYSHSFMYYTGFSMRAPLS